MFDPTGERLLGGSYDPSTLWDARTGERIAVLSHRTPGGNVSWRFDATGRLLVGEARNRDAGARAESIDVRDARTGDPVATAETGEVAWNTRFEWRPKDSRVSPAERRHAFQVPLPGGVLQGFNPSTRDEDFVAGPDGRRAVYLYRSGEGILRLVDAGTLATLATVRSAGWRAFFSGSGRFLACVGPDRVLLLEAEDGERLGEVPLESEGTSGSWGCAFDGDRLVTVHRSGQAAWWDPVAAREVRRLTLDPPPAERVGTIAFAAGGERLVVDGSPSLRVYDTSTGQQVGSDESRRYSLDGALAEDGRRLATGVWKGAPRILDVRTGATIATLAGEPLALDQVEILAHEQACVLSVSDGSLRRVDLATGRTTAIAVGPSGSPAVAMRSLDADRLLTWSAGRSIDLRDPSSLVAKLTIQLEPSERVLAVASDGSRVATRDAEDRIRVRSLAAQVDAIELDELESPAEAAAFSADGSRLALVRDHRVAVRDATSGARVADIPLADAPYRGPVAFYGDDLLAVGSGSEEEVGVLVLALPGGELVAHLRAPVCMLGGYVSDLRCDPDVGRIVFSVSSCGAVYAFDAGGWAQARWMIDYGGGNPASPELRRSPGSTRLHVSGMIDDYARVVDLVTGKVLAKQGDLVGFDLAGTSDDRFVAGTDEGLVVHSGESFERLYVRSEGPGGSAWLLRDGKNLEILDDDAWTSAGRHLSRGGASRPVDCWDAWLRDPLGLCPVPLDLLPEPPRIVDGPARALLAEEEEVELELEVTAEEPLLGIQVELAGRPTRLEPVEAEAAGTSTKARFTVAGPWPAQVRLRAVARSGTLSAPWRVDVEPWR